MDNSSDASLTAKLHVNENLTIQLQENVAIKTLFHTPGMNYSLWHDKNALANLNNTDTYNHSLVGLSNQSSAYEYNLSAVTDDYEAYEYPDYDLGPPVEEVLPVALVYGLTLVLGIVGNVLVIFSIAWYRRMRSVTNIFLTSLASADLLLVLICVPIKVSNLIICSYQSK